MASQPPLSTEWETIIPSKWFVTMVPASDAVKTTVDHILATSSAIYHQLLRYRKYKGLGPFCEDCDDTHGLTAWRLEQVKRRVERLVDAQSEEEYEEVLAELQNGWQTLSEADRAIHMNLDSEVCPSEEGEITGADRAKCDDCHRNLKPLWDRLHRAYAGLKVVTSYQKGEGILCLPESSQSETGTSDPRSKEPQTNSITRFAASIEAASLNTSTFEALTHEEKQSLLSALGTLRRFLSDISTANPSEKALVEGKQHRSLSALQKV